MLWAGTKKNDADSLCLGKSTFKQRHFEDKEKKDMGIAGTCSWSIQQYVKLTLSLFKLHWQLLFITNRLNLVSIQLVNRHKNKLRTWAFLKKKARKRKERVWFSAHDYLSEQRLKMFAHECTCTTRVLINAFGWTKFKSTP